MSLFNVDNGMFTLPMMPESESATHVPPADGAPSQKKSESTVTPPPEVGGRGGLDPTRYGDWEKNGRCIDF